MKRYRQPRVSEKAYNALKNLVGRVGNKYASKRTGYSIATVNLVNRTKDYAEYQEYNKSRRGKVAQNHRTWIPVEDMRYHSRPEPYKNLYNAIIILMFAVSILFAAVIILYTQIT